MREVELLESSFDGRRGRCVDTAARAKLLASREIFDSEVGRFAITAGDLVNHFDSFFVSTFSHQVFWRLVDGKAYKANQKHDQSKPTHSKNEPTPAGVFRAGTIGLILLTSEIA